MKPTWRRDCASIWRRKATPLKSLAMAKQPRIAYSSKKENFDAIVLDIMLPGKDGFSVVSELRAARNYVPVLMLTARGSPEDVLKGFAAGADDYLPKPFDLSILLARLQGLLRRSQWMRAGHPAGNTEAAPPSDPRSVTDFGTFSFSGKTIDFGTLELRTADNVVHLTLMESELLAPPRSQRRPGSFPQADSRRSLGPARRHRYACDRQLHGAAAALHRRRSRATPAFVDRARRGLPVSSESGKEVRRRLLSPAQFGNQRFPPRQSQTIHAVKNHHVNGERNPCQH